jgi:hypothetical protein
MEYIPSLSYVAFGIGNLLLKFKRKNYQTRKQEEYSGYIA